MRARDVWLRRPTSFLLLATTTGGFAMQSISTIDLRSTTRRRWTRPLAALCLVALASSASANPVFWVGTDGACNESSLQQALADAASAPDQASTIFVTREIEPYENVEITVNGKDLNLIGGYPSCGADADGIWSTITASGGHSGVAVSGEAHVYLSDITLTGADLNGDQSGGGIYFGGHGDLTLVGVAVTGNRAGYGGGIAVSPDGATNLSLYGSVVNLNTGSVEGGGIRIEGPTTLLADSNTFITTNDASGADGNHSGNGGGVLVIGPATATIHGSVNNNTANYGAGVAAFGHDGDATMVNIYATDPANPPYLYQNIARQTGGGVFLKSSDSDGATATICANDFVAQLNQAQNGAAFYADLNINRGSVVALNTFANCGGEPSDAVRCAAGVACNEIIGNVSADFAGNPTGGATVLIQSDGEFDSYRTAFRGNTGGSVVQFLADALGTNTANEVTVYDSLFADNVLNTSPGQLIYASGGVGLTALTLTNVTIANNTLAASSIIHADVGSASVYDSIVSQPSSQTVIDANDPPGTLNTMNVLSAEVASLGSGTGLLQGVPTFVAPANQDYHLQRTSPGVDFADGLDGLDLDGNPRVVDLADIPNGSGAMDLGAYEIQTQLPPPASCVVGDTVFCNGFEP
jgi:hypothetical protein